MKLFCKLFQNSSHPFLNAVRKISLKAKNEQLQIPKKLLNNGEEIPVIGLGTWGSFDDEARVVVTNAIQCGYRMIDTAFAYRNEQFVGQAIEQMIKQKVIKRKDIFVTTKLWNTYHQPDLVIKAVRLSLNNLKLSYLDLYLMHWPMAYQEGKIILPRDALGHTKFSNVDYLATWQAMEELQDLGLTKGIGLSNFNKEQIERVLRGARLKPAVLQCECHPFLSQNDLMHFCNCENIAFTAYGPLGGIDSRPYAVRNENSLLQAKEIVDMAERYEKTTAQILIRFQIQHGNIVIPRAVEKSHMVSNLQVFDWQLSSCDMNILNRMNRHHRFVDKFREAGKHKHYPFLDDYSSN